MVNMLANLIPGKNPVTTERKRPVHVVQELLKTPLKANPQTQLVKLCFTVFDLETTGFKPHQDDRVISLGAVKINNGKLLADESYYQLFKPERNIPSVVTRLTGIDKQLVDDESNLLEQLPKFFEWVGDSLLAAHIISFDLSFLNQALSDQSYFSVPHQSIDTREIIVKLFPQFTNCSLEEICERLGISTVGRHNALGDAIMAGRILEISIKELSKRGVSTLGDLEIFVA